MISKHRYPNLSILVTMAALNAAPSGLAQAQSAQANMAQATSDQRVEELFAKGAKARDAGNWNEARQAFSEAWALKQHEQIAANLGLAEYMLRDYASAAGHLDYFLKNAPTSIPAEDKERIQKMFDASREKVGLVYVEVNERGAEVWLGKKNMGVSPLKDAVYAEGGTHRVEARLNGYEPSQVTIEVKAGAREPEMVRLNLRKMGTGTSKLVEEDGKPEQAWIYAGIGATGAGFMTTVVSAAFSLAYFNDAEQRRVLNCGDYRAERAICERDYDSVRGKWMLSTNVAIGAGIFTGLAGLGTLAYIYWPWRKKAFSDSKMAMPMSLDIRLGRQSAGATAIIVW